jgi:hypothetical protein
LPTGARRGRSGDRRHDQQERARLQGGSNRFSEGPDDSGDHVSVRPVSSSPRARAQVTGSASNARIAASISA